MKIKDIISEVFNQPVEFYKNARNGHRQSYSFHIKDNYYYVTIFKLLKDDIDELLFADTNINHTNMEIHNVDFSVSREHPGDSDDITGTGNAYTVFATMYNIIEDFKKDNPSAFLLITSKNSQPSRVKLYSRMLDKLAKHKWEISEQPARKGRDWIATIPTQTAWII